MRVWIVLIFLGIHSACFAGQESSCWGVSRFTVATDYGDAYFRVIKNWEHEYIGRNYQGGGLIKRRYVALKAFFPLSKKPLLVIQHEESEFGRTYMFKGMTVLGLDIGECEDWSLQNIQDRLRLRPIYFQTCPEFGPLKPTVAYLIIHNDY